MRVFQNTYPLNIIITKMKSQYYKTIKKHPAKSKMFALKQGMDITVVSQMLGHSNPVSTMRRYTGIVSQNQDMVAYAMTNLLLGNDATHKKKIKFGK